jgi:trimeric autotransporter adhesin
VSRRFLATQPGNNNTASGFRALFGNTEGSYNTAVGHHALANNSTGEQNTASGFSALFSNTEGVSNTANGQSALMENTTGNNNVAVGIGALGFNSTGSNNIAVGQSAGANLTTGDNNIDIGNVGVAGESDTIRIGTQGTQTRTFIAGIRGTPIMGGVPVGVKSDGQLGVKPSSARYKQAIQPMAKASEAILALKPVTFRYEKELDPKGALQFGLVAEEVAKVNPDLIVADDQGNPFTVRYEEVNAMLLNEFLKEHRKNEQQEATIEKLKAEIATLSAMVKEQASQIQKVSAQVELSKPAPQTVLNSR